MTNDFITVIDRLLLINFYHISQRSKLVIECQIETLALKVLTINKVTRAILLNYHILLFFLKT